MTGLSSDHECQLLYINQTTLCGYNNFLLKANQRTKHSVYKIRVNKSLVSAHTRSLEYINDALRSWGN